MQIAIMARDDGGRNATDDLRSWLGRQRELRGRVTRGSSGTPEPGAMGTATELVTVLLAPGGVATVLAAAVVAWVQNRSGSQTVTITRPDGTEVTVTSERVQRLTAQQTGELARQIAGYLDPAPPQTDPADPARRGDQAPDTAPGARRDGTPGSADAAGSADAPGSEPRPEPGGPASGTDGRHP